MTTLLANPILFFQQRLEKLEIETFNPLNGDYHSLEGKHAEAFLNCFNRPHTFEALAHTLGLDRDEVNSLVAELLNHELLINEHGIA